MANNIKQNIQTIAQTKEIKTKLEKVTKELEILEKQAIEAFRSQATQTADSTKEASTSGTGNETGTDSSGSTETYPDAPTQTPTEQQESQTSTSTDTQSNYESTHGVGKSPTSGIDNTDLSGSGQTEDGEGGGGSLGGSGGKEQAEKGDNNAEIQDIKSAMTDAGYSADVIDQTVRELTQKKKGYHDVGDVIDGKAGPYPKNTSADSVKYGAGGNQITSSEKIHGVTGFDPDDGKAVVVNFADRSYIPSIKDAEEAGQDPWTTYDEGPLVQSYKEGFYWTMKGGSLANTVYELSFENMWRQAETEYGGKAYAYKSPDGIISLTPILGENILMSTDEDKNIGDGGGEVFGYEDGGTVSSREYGQQECGTEGGGLDDDVCSIPVSEAPRESAWPQLGVYLLNKVAGQFVGSVFDADLPNKYKSGNPQSSAQIESYDGRTFNILPGINGGTIIQDATLVETALYYDADGKLSAFVDPNQLNFYVPR